VKDADDDAATVIATLEQRRRDLHDPFQLGPDLTAAFRDQSD